MGRVPKYNRLVLPCVAYWRIVSWAQIEEINGNEFIDHLQHLWNKERWYKSYLLLHSNRPLNVFGGDGEY